MSTVLVNNDPTIVCRVEITRRGYHGAHAIELVERDGGYVITDYGWDKESPVMDKDKAVEMFWQYMASCSIEDYRPND